MGLIRTTLIFSANICPKIDVGVRISKMLSPGLELADHMCQFSSKTDNFDAFGLYLGKLSNYVGYSSSCNTKSVAESWMETEMSWVEVDVVGWSWIKLDRGGWSWAEVDGAGWRWVHGLAILSNVFLTQSSKLIKFLRY